jgi:hypothetical protein
MGYSRSPRRVAPAIAAVSASRTVVASPMLSGPSGVQEAAAPTNPGPIPTGSDEAHGVRCGWRAFAPALRPLPCLEGRPILRDRSVPATGVLVETLLDRGAESDVAEAEAAIERLAAAPADEGLVTRDIWLLRLQALLARAHGDAAAYADCRDRYRDMAKTLGFEGHIEWAEAMP